MQKGSFFCRSALAIARPYLRQTHDLLTAVGISHRFGLPVGNLVTVFLYILVLTCLFLWLRARELMDLLFLMRDEYNQTIVMVTHDMTLADRADVVFRIRDGAVE